MWAGSSHEFHLLGQSGLRVAEFLACFADLVQGRLKREGALHPCTQPYCGKEWTIMTSRVQYDVEGCPASSREITSPSLTLRRPDHWEKQLDVLRWQPVVEPLPPDKRVFVNAPLKKTDYGLKGVFG